MRAWLVAALSALLGAGLAGCGGAAAGSECSVAIGISPSQPEAGMTVVASASVSGLSGFETYEWTVTRAGAPVSFSAVDPDDSSIAFFASQAGTYDVTVQASVDGLSCGGTKQQTVNVQEPSADTVSLRLRAVPAPGQAPAHEWTFEVPLGADYDLGPLSLEAGIAAAGVVRDAADAPLPAYLRVVATAGNTLFESFAGADGSYDLKVPSGGFDLLVVPSGGDVAPLELQAVTADDLQGTISVPDGAGVTGSVSDQGGALDGAQVALAVEGVPSTLGQSDVAGDFSLAARPGATLGVSVVPPEGSGLPRLEGSDLVRTIADGADLEITYAGSLASRSTELDVLDAGDAPLGGARVTFVAHPIAGAGAIAVDGQAPLPLAGTARVSAEADGTGHVGPILLPEAVYDVIVEPPAGAGGSPLLTEIDLSAGAPSSLALPAPAMFEGTVTRAGAPLEGIRVSASPSGPLTASAAAGATGVTDASGAFSLPVVPGGDYEIVFLGPDGYRHRVTAIAPAAGNGLDLGEVSLPETAALSGELSIPGVGPAAGVHLALGCAGCPATEAAMPMAETVSAKGGGFVLAFPREAP